jgi:ribosome-binding factor A
VKSNHYHQKAEGPKRQERVASLVLRELATVILQEHIDPLFKGVTITSVQISPDLVYAKIFVTVLDEPKRDETLKALDRHSVLLQHLVNKKINLRVAVKLCFIYDTSIEHARKMIALIDKAIMGSKS